MARNEVRLRRQDFSEVAITKAGMHVLRAANKDDGSFRIYSQGENLEGVFNSIDMFIIPESCSDCKRACPGSKARFISEATASAA
jgi:hypothetical protein